MDEKTIYFEHFCNQASAAGADLLEKNAHTYPYSSLAAFLLLCHYKKTKHPGYEKFSGKAALHFGNTSWLQFLLDQIPDEETAPAITDQEFEKEIKNGNEINSGGDVQLSDGPAAGNSTGFWAPSDLSPENLVEQDIQPGNLEVPGPSTSEVAFEPLHTVDYFASQGIKVTEEPVSNDKLGSQVKSFTAWLKSMKKLHPSKLQEQDVVLEKLIQNSAEESNVTTEIYTEAMAEVLVKQDKKEKAIEMYNQLSLINPSKSAYFAGKIDNIKSS